MRPWPLEQNPLEFDNIVTPMRAALVIDMMANTDCSYNAAKSALAIWDAHSIGEKNIKFDNGDQPRSVKIGYSYHDDDPVWIATLI